MATKLSLSTLALSALAKVYLCRRGERGWRLQLCPVVAGDDPVRIGQLTNAKSTGTAGNGIAPAMLKHANRYGLKYIFVHDPYYEPLFDIAGWRKN